MPAHGRAQQISSFPSLSSLSEVPFKSGYMGMPQWRSKQKEEGLEAMGSSLAFLPGGVGLLEKRRVIQHPLRKEAWQEM